MSLLTPSWQGRIKATVSKYNASEVSVLETPSGRVLVTNDAKPFEVVTAENNLLVNVGITRALNLLIGAGGQAYDATHSRIGVGNDATAAATSQTDLIAASGATNRQFEIMDATFPSLSSQTLSWRATFTSGEANFVWNEWCLDVGTVAGTTVVAPMLNRKVAALGTKVNTAVWQFLVTLTLS